jgi:hypothetical protein
LSAGCTRAHDSPLLSRIPESQRQAVLAAFHGAVASGVSDPHEIMRLALLTLRHQLAGRWEPGRDALRTAVIVIMAHPTEAQALAQALLEEVDHDLSR